MSITNDHKHIDEIHFTDSNGLLIYFTDNSHTYIDPYLLNDIVMEFTHNWLKRYIDDKLSDEEIPDEELPFPDENYPFFTEGE